MRVTSVLAAGLVVGLALTGCGAKGGSSGSSATSSPSVASNGIADLTVQQILDKTLAAAKAAKSVHVKGEGNTGGSAFALDMQLRNGGGGKGSITSGGNTLQIITTGSTVYIKADKTFWTSNSTAAIAALIGDRWVKIPATNKDFASIANFGDFSTSLDEFLKPSSTPTKGGEKTINGQPALGLVDAEGIMWIASTGEPLPITIEGTGSSQGGLTFSDWNATVDIAAPADSDTLDLASLGQ